MKLINTLNSYNICTGTLYVGSHTVKTVSHIYNMGLFGCIFNYCIAVSKTCRQHNINCRSYRNNIHINMTSGKIIGLCMNHAMFYLYRCSKCLKALDMQIYRSASYIAASRKSNFCVAKFS